MLLTKQQMTSNSLALFCAPSCLTGDSKCRANLVFCPTFAHQTMNGTIRVLLGLLIAGCAACSQILLQGGTVVNSDKQELADVLINDGLIAAVGQGLQAPPGAQVLDVAGKLLLPGGIDPHTHLHFPFMGHVAADDFLSGQSAALAGGTTMHIDFALPLEGDLMAGFDLWQKQAAKSVMDYGLHMALTAWDGKVSADMAKLVEKGVNSFKFFFAYKHEGLMVRDELFLFALQRCKELGVLAMVHGENGDAIAYLQKETFEKGITGPEGHSVSRPAYLEGEATGRAVKLARVTETPLYVVHVMSKDAMDEIRLGHEAGQKLFGEVVSGALALTDEPCWDSDFVKAAGHVISPPLRSKPHQLALRNALAGGILQLVGTDHCGWNSTQKLAGRHDFRKIPNGIHGIEERLHILFETLVNTGRMTPSDVVRLFSTEAAKIFNLYPQKGVIAEGSDADLVVFDPQQEHTLSVKTHHSALDYSAYEGMHIKGQVQMTISQGSIVWQNGKLNVTPGSGRYIAMNPFAPHVYSGTKQGEGQWIGDFFPYGKTPVVRKGDKARSTHSREEL